MTARRGVHRRGSCIAAADGMDGVEEGAMEVSVDTIQQPLPRRQQHNKTNKVLHVGATTMSSPLDAASIAEVAASLQPMEWTVRRRAPWKCPLTRSTVHRLVGGNKTK